MIDRKFKYKHASLRGEPRNVRCLEFDTVGDWVKTCAAVPAARQGKREHRGAWAGEESFQEALALCTKGREDWAQVAHEVFDLLETGGLDLDMQTWQADRAGAFPVVPDFVAGIPECMRRKVVTATDTAPIQLYVDITASADFSADNLIKRGASCTALAIALSQHRPVSLYVTCGLSDGHSGAIYMAVKLDTIPMDMAQVAYIFGGASFFRKLCFAIGETYANFAGGWPFNYSAEGFRTEAAREILRLESTDIYIPSIHSRDPSVSNPLAWISSHLDKYRQEIQS